MAVRFKVWVCGHSLAGVACSNAAKNMDASLLWMLYVVMLSFWRRADHASRGALPSVMSECDCETSKMRRPKPTRAVEPWKKMKPSGDCP